MTSTLDQCFFTYLNISSPCRRLGSPSYHCSRNSGDRTCRQPYVAAADLERQFATWVGSVSLPQPLVEWCVEGLEELRGEKAQLAAATRREPAQERRRLELEIDCLVRMKTQGRINDAHFDRQYQDLNVRLEGLVRAGDDPAEENLIELLKGLVFLLNDAGNRFLAGGATEKRTIVASLGSNPVLLDKKLHIQAQKGCALVGASLKTVSICG